MPVLARVHLYCLFYHRTIKEISLALALMFYEELKELYLGQPKRHSLEKRHLSIIEPALSYFSEPSR